MSRVPLWLRVAVLVAALIAILATIAFEPARGQARRAPILSNGTCCAVTSSPCQAEDLGRRLVYQYLPHA